MKRYCDTVTMAGRCLLLSGRNPDTLLTSVILPALMMALFVSLFGRLIHVEGISYVNYIIPGILLQCTGQCSAGTAIMMNRDIREGMAGRFCTLPIKKASILKGHVLEGVARSLLTSGVVFLAAVPMGFRPSCGLAEWGIVLLLLLGAGWCFSWLAVAVGAAAGSAEGASALSSLAIVLPYLSSGFVPVEAMPGALQAFAKSQPLTPMIDTMRGALLGSPLEPERLAAALLWCAALGILFRLAAAVLFERGMRRLR